MKITGGFLVAFLGGVFFLEIFLSNAEITPARFQKLDQKLGLTFIPNMDFVRLNEGFSIGNTNDYGYFDLDEKASDEIRIALVGDSYVVGREVMKRNHFSSKIESEIEKVSGKEVKVMNFGMIEYDFCDAYTRYKNLAKKAKPDVVFWLTEEADLNCVNNSGIPELIMVDNELKIDHSILKSENSERGIFLKRTRLWSLLAKCKIFILKNRTAGILFGKFNNLFKTKNKPADISESKNAKIDHRVDNILDVLPRQTLLVFSKKINFDYKDIAQGFEGEVYFLDPAFDSLRATGWDPHYWKGSNQRGHFNQEAQKIMGERFSEELIIAMKKWELI